MIRTKMNNAMKEKLAEASRAAQQDHHASLNVATRENKAEQAKRDAEHKAAMEALRVELARNAEAETQARLNQQDTQHTASVEEIRRSQAKQLADCEAVRAGAGKAGCSTSTRDGRSCSEHLGSKRQGTRSGVRQNRGLGAG